MTDLWSDQHRGDHPGVLDAGLATPNLDCLAASSTLLERHDCTQPVCTSSSSSPTIPLKAATWRDPVHAARLNNDAFAAIAGWQ